MFTKTDLDHFSETQRNIETIKEQLAIFERGIPFAHIVAAATIENGIATYSLEERALLCSVYDEALKTKDVVKFVPASGAATRMFAHLVRFVNEYDSKKEKIENYFNKPENKDIAAFFNSFSTFPFAKQVLDIIKKDEGNTTVSQKNDRFLLIAKILLEKTGLDYTNIPKGLILFHAYKDYNSTPFEEQLFEATQYIARNAKAKLHFTVAEDHVQLFKKVMPIVTERIKETTKTSFQIEYSFQKKETDTIAVTLDNEVVRTTDGSLLFRPGGHGALIENLNTIEADIVFIKNIDNVIYKTRIDPVVHYKKVIAGKLIELQRQCFSYLEQLDAIPVSVNLTEIQSFVYHKLYVRVPTKTIEDVKAILNRPIRVCGVVKNTGAPGGGPYWVRKNGIETLQIVESAQIDTKNELQHSFMKKATHFNPVDIVCGIKNYKGNKFNLLDFVDKDAGFITHKTFQGKSIKALELPGLWNGAMAHWNTIFVEVPSITFNPVKTVNDLLFFTHKESI